MKTGRIPPTGFGRNTPEEDLKGCVWKAFFRRFEWRTLGKIDFCLYRPIIGQPGEFISLVWAEAKKGQADLLEALVQLVFTIGRERTFDRYQPPSLLAAFNSERIAFVPYEAVQAVFLQNDFNWNVAPSDHTTKEFRQLVGLVGESLQRGAMTFHFAKDEASLRPFIWSNLGNAADGVVRVEVDKNNFKFIYDRWVTCVKGTIGVDWDGLKAKGIIDGDFFLADLLSEDNLTLREKLFVLLRSDRYVLNRRVDESGLFSENLAYFTDGQAAHTAFWNRYARPPLEVYWDYMVDRRDLLVPPDIRERKGAFYTPQQWVELSQRYLAQELGENWQEEYTVWDPAAGTGNLLNGLTNKYNIWASTLDRQDVDVMRDRITNGSNLLESHVFQFDFLNDGFERLPKELKAIVDDPERRKKLVIYMNPPYAEATNARTKAGTGGNRPGVATQHQIRERYRAELGRASNELYAQFLIRIYMEMPGCIIGEFSMLKTLQGISFAQFRQTFQAKLKSIFLIPSSTFDNNSKGNPFAVGFKIWRTDKAQQLPRRIRADVYGIEGERLPDKLIFTTQTKPLLNRWLRSWLDGQNQRIGLLVTSGQDFQNLGIVRIQSQPAENHSVHYAITLCNLIPYAVYFAVRLCIKRTWLNNRDQFTEPKKGWRRDVEFQNDCLAFCLLHHKNLIRADEGVNHWIPYTEHEVGAQEKFQSHFMTDFMAGRLWPNRRVCEGLFDDQHCIVPREALAFSAEAQALLDAGRALWRYYHAQPKANPNASLYDIRQHFQGADARGNMNPTSTDTTYNALNDARKEALEALAVKLAPKVYEHGFLEE